MADYSKMTQDDFNNTLSDILYDMTGEQLLDIPGIYEILSEYFNNEVLEQWASSNPKLAFPEDYQED